MPTRPKRRAPHGCAWRKAVRFPEALDPLSREKGGFLIAMGRRVVEKPILSPKIGFWVWRIQWYPQKSILDRRKKKFRQGVELKFSNPKSKVMDFWSDFRGPEKKNLSTTGNQIVNLLGIT